MQRPYFSSAVKNVDHEPLWQLFCTRRIVQCLTATSTFRESFRHLEVHSTSMLGRKCERLFTEMSLMVNAQLLCVEVCERSVFCEFLSLLDIAKRCVLRTA